MEKKEIAIENWKKDLTSVVEGETIKAVYSEVPFYFFRELKDDIKRAIDEFRVKFNMIAGPVICAEEGTNDNLILQLASRGKINLHISPYRQLVNYRVFGNRFAYREDSSDFFENSGEGNYLSDPLSIAQYLYNFGNTIHVFKPKKFADNNSVVLLNQKQIDKIKKEHGDEYYFFSLDNFRKILGNSELNY